MPEAVVCVCVEFVRALVSLFRNVPYIYLAGVKIFSNMVIVGVLLNAVRYVEIAFYQPAFVASIISGPCSEFPISAAMRYEACFRAENCFCCQENQQKLLPPELHFLTSICTKSFVGWGSAPDPTGRAYSALQTP